MKKTVLIWLALGLASFVLLPWHMTDDGLFDPSWITDGVAATGLLGTLAGQWWLAPAGLALVVALILQLTVREPVKRARLTLGTAIAGLLFMAVQGLIIVRAGPRVFESLLTGDVIMAGQAGEGGGGGDWAKGGLFGGESALSQSGKRENRESVVGGKRGRVGGGRIL